jgi:phenylpyruvate tautomerase PptA (4-oxalocrotonate tautomerase family)
MPIIDVEIVGQEPAGGDLAARLADMAGQVFGSPPATTWVFVTILKAQQPLGAALEAEIRALTDGIASVCGRPAERVHILYEPDAQGRISFGGRLRT